GAAWAEDVPVEVTVLGENSITLHQHAFLTEDENTVLGLVATDASALALFVPEGAGFAALAASPDDGFIRDGVPVASAVALSGLADAEAARVEALAACEAARVGEAACVVVLEVAPAE
ncbi:MAG: hypothetical protein ACRC6I_20670, partial [Paracoccaceae bacterium]